MAADAGTARIAVEMRIAGHVGSDSFLDWICHRARLLDLTGWVRRENATEIAVLVSGAPVLVDAMEVACSLGPVDVLVERIESLRRDNSPAANGFSRL